MNVYDSISTLSIWSFNQISETHDFKLLLIDRTQKVDVNALALVWSNLMVQYMDAVSHREQPQNIIELQKAILEMSIEYNNIKTLCYCCSVLFDPKYIDELNSYGFDVKAKKDLIDVERSIRTLQTEIREKEFYLSKLMVNSGEPISFEKALDRLSKYAGYRLNPREITVKEWIAIEDNFIEDVKRNRRD